MKEMIRDAQAGCRQARRQLVTVLQPRLGSMARYYSRRSGLEAEDLLGEAWCAVFEALPETRLHIGTPLEYLVRRARWAMLDYLKWSLRRQTDSLEETPERGADGLATAAATRVGLQQAGADMSPIQRDILRLLEQGDTCTSAARQLGCTTANVSYHLGQVRRKVAPVLVP